MISELRGGFYDHIILQLMVPEVADVSAADYVAKKLTQKGEENNDAEQRPFVVAHNEEVTLRVETWLGKIIIWSFPACPFGFPMPLKRIIKDDANTATSIKISY